MIWIKTSIISARSKNESHAMLGSESRMPNTHDAVLLPSPRKVSERLQTMEPSQDAVGGFLPHCTWAEPFREPTFYSVGI